MAKRFRVEQQGSDLVLIADGAWYIFRGSPEWWELRELVVAELRDKQAIDAPTLGQIIRHIVATCPEIEPAETCEKHSLVHAVNHACLQCLYEDRTQEAIDAGYSPRDAHIEALLGDGPAE
jgi:hypothetical protein